MNTSGGQGYSLEQLLTWSVEDSLIDSYERQGEFIVLIKGKLRKVFPFQEARAYLKGMFRQHVPERTVAARHARPVRVPLVARRQSS